MSISIILVSGDQVRRYLNSWIDQLLTFLTDQIFNLVFTLQKETSGPGAHSQRTHNFHIHNAGIHGEPGQEPEPLAFHDAWVFGWAMIYLVLTSDIHWISLMHDLS